MNTLGKVSIKSDGVLHSAEVRINDILIPCYKIEIVMESGYRDKAILHVPISRLELNNLHLEKTNHIDRAFLQASNAEEAKE